VAAGFAAHMHTALISLLACLYFWLVWNNYYGITSVGLICGVACGIGAYFMPESPKFLISIRKYDEARKSINYIAKFNNQEPFNGKFDREVSDRRGKSMMPLNVSSALSDDTSMDQTIVRDALMSPKQRIKEEKQLDGSI
jgi:Sugar (and other) transporter